jgi:hypothetical protein
MSHRRFRIHWVDSERRLFVFVSSAHRYYDAGIARDTLLSDHGGDWVIIDHESGLVVSDTRRWDDARRFGQSMISTGGHEGQGSPSPCAM